MSASGQKRPVTCARLRPAPANRSLRAQTFEGRGIDAPKLMIGARAPVRPSPNWPGKSLFPSPVKADTRRRPKKVRAGKVTPFLAAVYKIAALRHRFFVAPQRTRHAQSQ